MMTTRRILLGVGILFAALRASAQPAPNWTSGTFVYDGAGNIVRIGSDSYTYDALSRLTAASVSGHSQAFQYDAMGNLTHLLTDGDFSKEVIPAIDPGTNRLLPAKSGATYFGSHDAAGNLVSTLSTSYAYDGLNMMKEATGPNGQHDVYVYNADDERVGTIAVTGAFASPMVTPTSYRWTIRGLGNEVLREFDDNLGPGGTHNWSWKEDYIYANGHLLAAETSSATLHFFPDHLGTPRVITGSTGTVISKHTYYPFGDEITVAPQDPETHRFTGHERDTSLDYMHARYYASSAGRFLSVDPAVDQERSQLEPQGWNRYAYGGNNPSKNVDADGRQFDTAWQMQREHQQLMAALGQTTGDQVYQQVVTRSNEGGAAGALLVGGALLSHSIWTAASVAVMANPGTALLALRVLNAMTGNIDSRINVPGPTNAAMGKADYLLGNVASVASRGKGGFFSGVLGFGKDTLISALKSQLGNNLDKVALDGSRATITAPMTGPNGVTAVVKTVWEIENGVFRFITAVPGPR